MAQYPLTTLHFLSLTELDFLEFFVCFTPKNEGKTWSHLYHVIPSFGCVKQTKNSKKSSSGVSDGTFKAKKDQPKLDIRTMLFTDN